MRAPRAAGRHLRRYPGWYAVAVVWLAAMVALPVVGLDPLGVQERATTGAPAPAPGGPGGTDPSTAPTPDAPAAVVAAPVPEGTGDPTSTTAPTATTDPELDLVPPEVLDLVFDAIPPLVLPPLPEELATLARAIAPLATTGCTGLGLASVVVAVAAQTVEGVPLERLLPYLAPVSTACAAFPVPTEHTVCALDQPLLLDLAGLTTSPPILGLGIDQLAAIEQLMADTVGTAAPQLAPHLRDALDCEVVRRV